MRDIKFRAWDKENKEMLNVQELDYQDSYNEQPMVRTTMYSDYFDTEDIILMQYTGLKDKNGKEIYEGDIVKVFNNSRWIVGKVIYEHCGFIVNVTNNKDLNFGRVGIIERFIKVIGNIYEDSDLLKEKEQ